ncbi:hypothetical protein PsYK624_081610 [Phanerochaete sordida]|uniref:Fungal-type protein kinase domain-containing protein n=1 Tax=Phanerochaete sordida TaxID=48140 RepID=A0A9P3LEY1_9APHY|nr:hypothetical protein PsYK624_081610 [Phanerochaete sordida]
MALAPSPLPGIPPRVQTIGRFDTRFIQVKLKLDQRRIMFGTEMNPYTVGPMPVKTMIGGLMPDPKTVRTEGVSLERCVRDANFKAVLQAKTELELQQTFAECLRNTNISPRLVTYNTSAKVDPIFAEKPDLAFKVLFRLSAGSEDEDEESDDNDDSSSFDFWRTLLGAEAKKHNVADPFADNPEEPKSGKATKSKKSKSKTKKDSSILRSSINPTSAGASSRGQVGMYSNTQFGFQHRRHLWQLIIIGPNARLVYYDRSGLISSESFNYTEDPEALVTFFWLLSRMDSEYLGCDSTVRDATVEEMADYAEALDTFFADALCKLPDSYDIRSSDSPIYAVQVHDEHSPGSVREVIIGAPLTTTRAVAGRGTRVYLAYDPNDKKIRVLKDTWYPVHPAFKPETEIYGLLTNAGVTGIAKVICGGDVLSGGLKPQETIVQDWATRPQEECPWRAPCADYMRKFRHLRMLMDFVYPVECLESSYALTKVLADICETIHLADSKAGVVHRDITPRHIGLVKKASGWGGILLDWDHAGLKDFVLSEEWPTVFCSSTTHFMSIRLLEDPALKRADQGDRSHQLVDDMEAVFWTFLWLCLQYFKHSSPLLGGDENLFDEVNYPKRNEGPALWYGGVTKLNCLVRRQLKDLPFESEPLAALINSLSAKWNLYYMGEELGEDRFRECERQLQDPKWMATYFDDAARNGSWPSNDRSDYQEFVPTPWAKSIKDRNVAQTLFLSGRKENVPMPTIRRAASRMGLQGTKGKRGREDDQLYKFSGKKTKTQSGSSKVTYWLRSGKTYKFPRPSGLTGPIKALGISKLLNRGDPDN